MNLSGPIDQFCEEFGGLCAIVGNENKPEIGQFVLCALQIASCASDDELASRTFETLDAWVSKLETNEPDEAPSWLKDFKPIVDTSDLIRVTGLSGTELIRAGLEDKLSKTAQDIASSRLQKLAAALGVSQ